MQLKRRAASYSSSAKSNSSAPHLPRLLLTLSSSSAPLGPLLLRAAPAPLGVVAARSPLPISSSSSSKAARSAHSSAAGAQLQLVVTPMLMQPVALPTGQLVPVNAPPGPHQGSVFRGATSSTQQAG